jgi:hypothetical protein
MQVKKEKNVFPDWRRGHWRNPCIGCSSTGTSHGSRSRIFQLQNDAQLWVIQQKAKVVLDTQLAAEQLAAKQLASEQLAAEKLAAEKLAAEKLAAEQPAAKQLAAKQLAAKQHAAKQLAPEQQLTTNQQLTAQDIGKALATILDWH